MSKQTKDQAKKPDLMTQQLKKGFEWTTTHSKIVFSVFALFIVLGLGWSLYRSINQKKELEAQAKYYLLEADYLKTKEKFDQYRNWEKQTQASKAKTAAPKPEGAIKASGDLQTDYGSSYSGLKALVQEHPKTRAAQLAALLLGEMAADYGKEAEALAVIETLKADKGLLASLMSLQKGSLLANDKKCAEAIVIWERLLANPEASFLANETKLRLGLCYLEQNNVARAEQLWTEVAQQTEQDQFTRTAEKYLRSTRFKGN